MRTELSEKNKYFISKYRYLELKYRCLQYPAWKKSYDSIDILIKSGSIKPTRGNTKVDPVVKYALARDFYYRKMKVIEDTVIEADEELYSYILKGVTEGVSYDVMNANDPIPCSRDTYYDRYRRFFFLLSHTLD